MSVVSRSVELSSPDASHRLGRYTDPAGRPRVLVLHHTTSGGGLLLDEPAFSSGEAARLLAELAADEPAASAEAICADYLRTEPARRTARVVRPGDWSRVPGNQIARAQLVLWTGNGRRLRLAPGADVDPGWLDELEDGADERRISAREAAIRVGSRELVALLTALWSPAGEGVASLPAGGVALRDRHGDTHRLRLDARQRGWRHIDRAGDETRETVRQAIGRLQAYEPVLTLTRLAVDADPLHAGSLAGQLAAATGSSKVLNRGLRERFLALQAEEEVGPCLVAERCGRVCRRRGKTVGDSSWLRRRLGLLPDRAGAAPTPWITAATLALIARQGLRVAPSEVELG